MKKLCIALLVTGATALLFAPSTASAQSFEKGVKVGINAATVSITDPNVVVNSNSRTGLLAGGFVRRQNPDSPFGIQIEALVSQKGVEVPEYRERFRATYFEVPILARYAIQTSGDARPYVAVGPSLALKLSASYEPALGKGDPEIVKGSDLGLSLGGGVEFGRAVIDLRYTLGLMNIFTDEFAANPRKAPTTAKSRTFSISVGYRLGQ